MRFLFTILVLYRLNTIKVFRMKDYQNINNHIIDIIYNETNIFNDEPNIIFDNYYNKNVEFLFLTGIHLLIDDVTEKNK